MYSLYKYGMFNNQTRISVFLCLVSMLRLQSAGQNIRNPRPQGATGTPQSNQASGFLTKLRQIIDTFKKDGLKIDIKLPEGDGKALLNKLPPNIFNSLEAQKLLRAELENALHLPQDRESVFANSNLRETCLAKITGVFPWPIKLTDMQIVGLTATGLQSGENSDAIKTIRVGVTERDSSNPSGDSSETSKDNFIAYIDLSEKGEDTGIKKPEARLFINVDALNTKYLPATAPGSTTQPVQANRSAAAQPSVPRQGSRA